MKSIGAVGLFVLFLSTFAACQKDVSTEGNLPHGDTILTGTPTDTLPASSGNRLVRIQSGTDRDLNNDTIYRITYNTSNTIGTLIDSLNRDTLTAAYNTAGNLTSITENNPYAVNAHFTYDSIGELTRINYNLYGSNEQYAFEYTNGVVSRRNYYSDRGMGGSVKLQEFYDYTVTAGNITGIREYSATGTLVSATTYTYGPQPNPFKVLSQFNYADQLGLNDIMSYETYFNKNIMTGFTVSGLSAVMTNTFNNKQQITGIVANDQVNSWLLTWQFSYK